VFGEHPYAEGQGDVDNLQFDSASKQGLTVMRKLKADGIPVVGVFLSGRPMWLNAEINAADALVAAWLPGSEGGGVADLLLRDTNDRVRYEFTGRLSFDWPNSDINISNSDLPVDDVLFPYGYGLAAGQASSDRLNQLSERASVAASATDVVIFERGSKAPWRPYLGDASDWRKLYPGGIVASQYGELTVAPVDLVVQEDGRRLRWSGNGQRVTQFYWQADSAVDLSALASEQAALVVEYKVNKPANRPVELRMDCGYPCSGEVDITAALQAESGQWRSLAVPLSCFSEHGVALTAVNTPALLSTSGALDITLRRVAVTTSHSAPASCP
jgi:beta-glucosidase